MIPGAPDPVDRLDSWKQIAAHFGKSERTVRRWHETEGMPVHKHPHRERGSVWAYRQELDGWLEQRRIGPQPPSGAVVAGDPALHWKAALVSLAVCILLAVAILGFGTVREPPQLPDPSPLTSLPGQEYGAAVSPDGKRVAFYWSPPDRAKQGIYIKSLDTDELVPLILTPPESGNFEYSPAWSPDGKTIAFLRRTGDRETWIYLVAPSGGPARPLIRLMREMLLYADRQHLSWSLDSRRILAPVQDSGYRLSIQWISIDGGARQRITAPEDYAQSPLLSPDGRTLAYLGRQSEIEIRLQKLAPDGSAAGPPQTVTTGQTYASGLAWTPDGEDLLFCGAQVRGFGYPGNRLFRLHARPGSRLVPIGAMGCVNVTVWAARDGGRTRLIYGANRGSRVELRQASLAALHRVSEFAPSSRQDGYPAFSPDGTSVAFVSTRGGDAAVWLAGRDGGNVRRLANQRPCGELEWSPDGKRILFESPWDKPALMTVPVAGGPPSRLPIPGSRSCYAYWFHGGDWIFYAARDRLLRSHPDGSGRTAVEGAARVAAVSPDGKVMYRTWSQALYRRPFEGGAEELVEPKLFVGSVAASRTALYFVRQEDRALYALPFAGGAPKKIGVLPGFETGRPAELWAGFTVSPDDARVIWAVTRPQEIDLEQVPGFR